MRRYKKVIDDICKDNKCTEDYSLKCLPEPEDCPPKMHAPVRSKEQGKKQNKEQNEEPGNWLPNENKNSFNW